jgi:23S rRNA maturation-related 3'-5' exoribonuclease YhaM
MKQRTMNEIRQSKEYQIAKNLANTPSKNPFEHEEVDKTVNQIVEDLQPEIFNAIFQMINDEMSKRYVFDSSEYLTESGLELFEDEWFEFYHENHGRIMHKLLQNLK